MAGLSAWPSCARWWPGADAAGVDSTSAGDARITAVGAFVRRTKLDELGQLLNVAAGTMSLVGPCPNVPREVVLYSDEERHLLSVRPGMTDIASIVFADEGDILAGHDDADLAYHQYIRPWKNRLGLAYVEHRGTSLDLRILWLTVLALVSRRRALLGVASLLDGLGAERQVRTVAARRSALPAAPPPGLDQVVQSR